MGNVEKGECGAEDGGGGDGLGGHGTLTINMLAPFDVLD